MFYMRQLCMYWYNASLPSVYVSHTPGMLNWDAKTWTSFPMFLTSSLSSRALTKSTSFLPVFSWMAFERSAALHKKPAMTYMSSSFMPLVVRAGVPSLIPPGVTALLSPTTEFLFVVMCIISKIFSTLEPVRPWGLRSHMTV